MERKRNSQCQFGACDSGEQTILYILTQKIDLLTRMVPLPFAIDFRKDEKNLVYNSVPVFLNPTRIEQETWSRFFSSFCYFYFIIVIILLFF